MTGAFIILGITLLTGLILYITRDRSATVADSTAPQEEIEEEEVCCGRHAVCEKGLLTSEELYYNDEELDSYKGREPGSYTPEEIEEFRKYTETKKYVEEVAKERLGLVYEDEILFKATE